MYTELDSNSESRGRRGVKHEPHAIRQLVLRRRSGTTHSVGAFCRSFFVSGSRPKWKGAARGNNVILLPTWKSFGRSCLPGCHFLSPAGGAGGAAGAGACRRREGPRRGSAARPGSPPRHQSPFYRVRAPATTHSRPRACLCQTSRTPNGPTPPFPPSS
jgi:hypothetical protein